MKTSDSACGIYDCGSCEHQTSGRCPGCAAGNEAARANGDGSACRVYGCVQSRGLGSCAECAGRYCDLWRVAELICPLRSRLENERWWAGKMSSKLRKHNNNGPSRNEPSEKVINRVRWYLTALDTFAAEGRQSVPSWQLAEKVGVSPALIRKDLSKFGEFGTPSYGYRVDFLRERLRSVLCLNSQRQVIWVGPCAGKLSPEAQDRLSGHNCVLSGIFHEDGEEVGGLVGNLVVQPLGSLREHLKEKEISAAVLAVQGAQAHAIALLLVELGVRAILNLSGELLVLPSSVRVTTVDLIGELLELCYYC